MRVLDVGCGHSAVELAGLRAPGALKVGLDLVKSFCGTSDSRMHLMRADCTHVPFQDATFDLVLCGSVLEHLDDPEASLCEICRVLKPNGYLAFLTPNLWSYVSMAACLIPNAMHPWLVKGMTGRDEQHTFPTAFRANTTGRLRKLAERSGLEVVKLTLVREHPHYLQFNSVCYLLGLLYEQVFQRCIRQLRPQILGILRRPNEE